ncbi:hypothetical protein MTR_8g066823 [Medicago truncatula]|uniref:Uncharacterized protein n=1 Tax=Medicago truncatula TaxID=3880 RepID=A0A072U2N9_MEDTR|nr:hypothetical protein MTR_8g066823 [Medicago truncatula]
MSFAPRKEKGIVICPKVTNEYLAEMKELDRIASEKANPVQVPFPTGTTSLNPPSYLIVLRSPNQTKIHSK